MATGRRWSEGVTKKREAKESRQLWTGRVRVAFTRPRRRLSGCFDGDEGQATTWTAERYAEDLLIQREETGYHVFCRQDSYRARKETRQRLGKGVWGRLNNAFFLSL